MANKVFAIAKDPVDGKMKFVLADNKKFVKCNDGSPVSEILLNAFSLSNSKLTIVEDR